VTLRLTPDEELIQFRSALQIAVDEGDLEVFRLLLNRGADINAQGGNSGSAVSTAAREHNTMLKELLEHGADAALGGSVALVSAARYANNEAISILLDHGADLHCQEGVAGRALHVAAKEGNVSTVKLLLDRGADVNAFGGEYGWDERHPELFAG
jgi:ankyrin repeat protein